MCVNLPCSSRDSKLSIVVNCMHGRCGCWKEEFEMREYIERLFVQTLKEIKWRPIRI